MKCPRPDELLRLVASGGDSAPEVAAHLESCPECQALLDRLAISRPSEALTRLVAENPPTAVGSCPEPEELAAWCDGTSLSDPMVEEIGSHVVQCESCACAASLLRLELLTKEGPAAAARFRYCPSYAREFGLSLAPSRVSAIAMAAGGMILLAVTAFIIAPGLMRLARSGISTFEPLPTVSPTSASTVISGLFEYRASKHAGTNSQPFSDGARVQLSPGYEYAIELRAQRPGWLLLVTEGPGGELTLMTPDSKSKPIEHVEAGRNVRYPTENWEVVSAVAGQREFYALYFGSELQADSFSAKVGRTAHSIQDAAAVRSAIIRAIGDIDCSNSEQGCGVAFTYEVF